MADLILNLEDLAPEISRAITDENLNESVLQTTNSDRIEALGFARYLASIHIVLGHMHQGGNLTDFRGLNRFGYTWVPWFFLLSGFVLTLSERRKKRSSKSREGDDEIQYVFRRLDSMYPAYLLGLLSSVATICSIKGGASLPLPVDAVLFVCLLQSWLPTQVNYGFVYLTQCWFLSCLLLYWLLFYRIYAFIEILSTRALLLVVGFCSLALPILYEAASTRQENWYDGHKNLNPSRGVDTAVLVLKFHPFAYIHIFILGCCLPRVQKLLQDNRYFLSLSHVLSALSYLALLILFCCGGQNIPGYKLGFRLGIISAVHCLLLLGLSNKNDVLAKIFSLPALSKLGEYSFPQYVFQFLVLAWFHDATKETIVDIRFFLLLFTTSVFVSRIVAPLTNRKSMEKVIVVMSVFLMIYTMLQPYWSKLRPTQGRQKVHQSALPSWWNDSSLIFNVAGTLC